MISCIYYVRGIGKVRSVIALAYAATDEGCYSLYVPIKPIPSDLLHAKRTRTKKRGGACWTKSLGGERGESFIFINIWDYGIRTSICHH